MLKFTTLVEPRSLADALERSDVILFDCRFDLADPSWGEKEFALAHLPGAQYLHLDRDLSGPVTDRSGRHPLPDPVVLATRLAKLGVSADRQVITYDQGNGVYAARAWWLMRWLGVRAVAVLDGGLGAWRATALPLTSELRAPVTGTLEVNINRDAALSADAVEVLRLSPGNLLIDARGADRFAGRNETLDPVSGHIPGARNHPFAWNLDATGTFLPRERLRQGWQTVLGSLPPSAVISMCGSGVTACHNLLALEHAGLAGGRLYAGSWSEWIRDAARPIATGTF